MTKTCWNCGSSRFIETVSRERCPNCGIECDYWGGGTNEAYGKALKRKHARVEQKMIRLLDERYGED